MEQLVRAFASSRVSSTPAYGMWHLSAIEIINANIVDFATRLSGRRRRSAESDREKARSVVVT